MNEYREPFGAAETGTKVSLSIDVKEAEVHDVRAMVWRGEEVSPTYYDMSESEAGSGRYSTKFKVPDEGCLLWYAFEIKEGDSTVYYGNNSQCLGGVGQTYDYSPECYQITVYKPSEVPNWYTDGIVYQIFPDRFARDDDWEARCSAANERVNSRREDVKRVLEHDWYKPANYVRDDRGHVAEWDIYGGSLRGIESKLDYIKSLGATSIYLNPIFEATSNHRYDTANYMHIDPALGTDDDFVHLAEAAKEKGIRIILDGVFSHTGSDSIYFDKYGNYPNRDAGDAAEHKGAWNNEDSPYRSWYKFDENEDIGYKSWWGVEDLPEVNETDASYMDFMLSDEGVMAHWLKMGASGWRLDVADELPDEFIKGCRKTIDSSADDALLLGEVWEDASNKISYDVRREFLLGDELHCTMNYPLRTILLDYINYTVSSGHAAEQLVSLSENYPKEHFYAALNLIGSHDRERILTAMAAEEDYDSAARKVKLLAGLQYTLPGVPCVYYGDEAGLTGGPDPANRSCYPWERENKDLAYHYRMLGLLYNEHPALKDGEFTMLSGTNGISDDIFAFTREGHGEKLLVLASRSYDASEIDLSGIEALKCDYALELLASEELKPDENGSLGTIKMDRLSIKIILLKDEAPKSQGFERSAGVICHISSLGTPKLGAPAREFVDFISSAGFKIWQILPLNPCGTGGSPYSSHSAFAGNPDFINPDELPDKDGFKEFARANSDWLTEYAVYTVLRNKNEGESWQDWPEDEKFGDPHEILNNLSEEDSKEVYKLMRQQYAFDAQWRELKEYANSKGVSIMGDLPMFMSAESSDVWANKEVFKLDEDGRQKVHAGAPPDAFTGDGQDWGNPLYDWDYLKDTDYEWWLRRIRQCAERFDMLRIDHFRGLSEFYSIPEGANVKDGEWQHGPGLSLFRAIYKMFEEEGLSLKLLAEDLGMLDNGVKNLIELTGIPGINVWQFSAFEMLDMPKEEAAKRAFYTGTHDNNTLMGFVRTYLGDNIMEEELIRECIRIMREIYESPALLAMLQIQDVFFMGSEARMNVPGTPEGNWTWKLGEYDTSPLKKETHEVAEWFRHLAEENKR